MHRTRNPQTLITAFERKGGFLPQVALASELYDDYARFARAKGATVADIDTFVTQLTGYGGTPCRLPDGSLGFIGVLLAATATPAERA